MGESMRSTLPDHFTSLPSLNRVSLIQSLFHLDQIYQNKNLSMQLEYQIPKIY